MERPAEPNDDSSPLNPKQLDIEQRILYPSLSYYPPRFAGGVSDDGSSLGAVKAEDIAEDLDNSSDLWNAVAEVIDLTGDEPAVKPPGRTPKRSAKVLSGRRNEPIEPQLLITDRDSIVKRGHFVELEAALSDLWETTFLLVQEVYQPAAADSTDEGLVLRGLPFTRTRFLRGKLPRHRNEVCLILQVDADDDRPDHVQAAVDIPLRHAMGTRQFHFTNGRFPSHRFDGTYQTAAEVERCAPLTCRWKYRLVYKDAASRVKAKAVPIEFVLAHINSEDEMKTRFRVKDSVLMNQWRGGKVEGGSYDKMEGVDLAVRDALSLDDEESLISTQTSAEQVIPSVKPVGQRYTFGDMFSGAGGASYGARCAGFHIRTACDHWKDALETYRHNFPETELHGKDVFELLMEVPDGPELHVDVLHLSPPCQFWSPAHTVKGKNDEQNIAALMSCHRLIHKFRPRLFTLEQTFGILDPRFEYYFNALLLGFTQHGYSVRWRILRLENWGLPSPRKRLIMLGACSGEQLPDYPPPTHAQNPEPGVTKPYRTVYESLLGLPPPDFNVDVVIDDNALANRDPLHRVQKIRDDIPWDPDAGLLLRAITCNGGYGNHHWSGERDFTRREYATLNGFPRRYEFRGRNYQRQIGNAFPARFTRALYSHLRQCLERADAAVVVANPEDPQEVAFGDGDELSDEEEDGVGARHSRWRPRGNRDEDPDDEVVFEGRRIRKREPAPLGVIEWKDDEDDVMEIDGPGGGEVILISESRPAFLCVDVNQRAPPPRPLMGPWNFPASSRDNPIDLDNSEDLIL
ncbi:modification methylase Sau96I [Apiospora rasikravindrae]|uniref:DNA (cytosine-5-)-methyltransferase n=1 Tax=Apiospora rasikravindrae TaxID=990691 RepID=A0ABR1T0R2_9PEZI